MHIARNLSPTMFFSACFLFLILISIPSNCSNLNSEKSSPEIVGDRCQLKEPVYDHLFDFAPLQSEFGHKVNNEKGDLFEFNVCGKLSKGCGGNSNAAACLTRNNKAHVLGNSHKLIYSNGKTYFSFTDGDKCIDGKNFTLNVMILCDYTMDVQPFSVTPTADSECSFYINWETRYACLPLPDNMKSNLCTVKDQETGHIFDLMPLSDSNYRSIDRNGSFFIINVCKPVLYGQNSMCPADSSICHVDSKSDDIKTKYLNYGIAQPAPILQNGQLIMRFSSLVKCNATEYITSTIYFNCDQEVKFGTPDFMGKRECNYQFTWQTSFACNTIEPCVAHNPISGKQYDFNIIAGVYIAKHDAKEYTIGICKQAGSPCHGGDGACETSNGQVTSLGDYSVDVIFNETWAPYLLYTSGKICENNVKWSTKIEFVCATNDMALGPKIIENTNCKVLINFVTQYACKDQILCKIESSENNDKIDLTPLIGTTENYIATVNASLKLNDSGSLKFFLNVCRPLVQQFGLSCSAGSAACKTEMVSSSSTPEYEESLGYPDVSLTLIDKTTAQLLYLRGSQCPSDSSVKMSSRIYFVCDITAGKGNPILQSISEGCHYWFYWGTNVMCSTHQCKFDANTCDIINDETQKSFNMRTAKFTNNGNITVNANPNPFNINVCGLNRIAVTDYAHSTIKVFFDTIGPCGIDGSISVELRLVCRGTERRSSLSDNKACSLVFTQETPEICPLLGLAPPPAESIPVSPATEKPVPSTDNKSPNTNESKGKMVSTAAAIITIAMITLVVVSIVCLRDPVKRAAVKNFFRKNTHAVLYRRVDTVEEANLLLPQVDHQTDSDDDLLL